MGKTAKKQAKARVKIVKKTVKARVKAAKKGRRPNSVSRKGNIFSRANDGYNDF